MKHKHLETEPDAMKRDIKIITLVQELGKSIKDHDERLRAIPSKWGNLLTSAVAVIALILAIVGLLR